MIQNLRSTRGLRLLSGSPQTVAGNPGRGRIGERLPRWTAVLRLAWMVALAAAGAGEAEVENGVVRVVTLGEQGSGFVVGIDRGITFLVTAAHVVEGVQSPQVSFAADPHNPYRAQVVRVDPDNDVAALKVEGRVKGVMALPFDERPVEPADVLQAIGFPGRALRPRWQSGALSGREGGLILFDQSLDEGYSGGPLLRDGSVVGLVKETDPRLSFAVPATFIRKILQSWEVPVRSELVWGKTPLGEESQWN